MALLEFYFDTDACDPHCIHPAFRNSTTSAVAPRQNKNYESAASDGDIEWVGKRLERELGEMFRDHTNKLNTDYNGK
ncbi:hypothetical protein SARC_17085, partial [Sphaeroforma arctica JP610]